MNKIIGFIGSGNMGRAMIGGIIKSKLVEPKKVIISDLNQDKLNSVQEEFGVLTTMDSKEVVKKADIIILAVKPNIYDIVMESIKEHITKEKIIVTIAAGKTIENIETILGKSTKIVRTMPNTPALVNEGMSALCANKNVTEEELKEVKSIFDSFGESEIVSEYLIDSVVAVSGSSPAYVFMLIEAMADGAVIGGMPRDKAYKFAAQAVLGSAKMVLETGKHPGELKDMVCSPGGTTIEAVRTLESKGMRTAIIEAIVDCMNKSRDMSKNS
ncbi:pyrroline-5-carboxylate reductase [Clostridium butanoliproducens]|uniref:pyrroline-5-carboxylate reductase n=1 Tax=Clostridium butanoliproducens TaxID=2991837 RepID=UPI0024BA6601|nr:pyrroline-5-carboxylate reductase [Clostridium butanoliproducens]